MLRSCSQVGISSYLKACRRCMGKMIRLAYQRRQRYSARSARSEERRVGKECRSRWASYDYKKNAGGSDSVVLAAKPRPDRGPLHRDSHAAVGRAAKRHGKADRVNPKILEYRSRTTTSVIESRV